MEVNELERMIREQQGSTTAVLPALMRKVYLWMTMALVITGICAYGVATSPALLSMIYGNSYTIWVLMIIEFGVVFYTTSAIRRLSLTTATLLFILYSAINGVVFSSIFVAFTLPSIAKVFFITAGTFAVMALYGYFTKTDLSKIGNILFMALIGLIIATVANLFIKSSAFDLIISYIGVLIFVGLTAWDSQKIRQALSVQTDMSEGPQKMALMGALSLYLDFINMFLFFLRIFGGGEK